MIYALYLEDDLICNAITIKESISSDGHDISTVGIICLTPMIQDSILSLLNSTIECLSFKIDSENYQHALCYGSNITIKIPSFWSDTHNGLIYLNTNIGIVCETVTIDTPLVEFYGTIQCYDFKSDGSINNIHTLQLFDNEHQSTWEVRTNNNINVTYTSLQDSNITGDGEYTALISNGCIDRGGNTGWIFDPTPPVTTKYWVGNSGNWSDTAHWSLESGGPSGASVPTTGETAIFDENSGSTIMVLISSEVLCAISIMPDAYYKVSFGLVNGGVLSLLDDLKHISGLLVGGSSIFQTNNFDLEGSYIAFVEQCVATLGVSTITINPGYFEPIDLIISALMIEPSETIDADEVTCIINSDGAQVAGFICGQDIESVTINASIGCEVIYCATAGINTISSLSILGDGIIVCSIPDGPEGFSNVIIADHVVLNGLTPGGLSLIGVDNVWTLSVASGTVSAENCTIINSIATGGATFNALETEADGNVDGGGNTGWYFGENRYRCWINGSGNWNDPSHWSTYSGGPSGAAPPLSANGVYFDVYFDLNSFTEGGQEVTLSAGVCKSMTWQNALYLPTLIFSTGSANETLTVYGDITFKSGMYIDYYSSINLPMFINNISEDGIDPSIIIAGDCHLTNATIPLPPMRVNENITLTLEDDFVGSTLYVKGNLDAQEHDITVKAIKICPETSLYNIRVTSNEYIRIDSNGNIRISILG